MRNYSLAALMGALLILLAGCQTFSGSSMLGLRHSDSSITMAVKDALAKSNQFTGLALNVETTQGNVLLSGYVKTIRQSDVAADIASKVDGVKFVENGLIVRK
ncbi:MAG: BON domain-containing protein [Legionella sp.]|nr:BON domain-containing protein [Legionella sp.]